MQTILLFLSFILIANTAQAQVFKNISVLQNSLGFKKYYATSNPPHPLKVAIFDKGFEGFQTEIGKSLPANTVYIPGPVPAPDDLKTEHGLRMAQIFTALTTNNLQQPQMIQEFYLYNVFGFSNFKAAIDDAIQRGVDVISYSEVWEYGGNHDGHGFINAQVARATAAGILWINAAGNFALTSYNSAISTGNDDWVKLPDQNSALTLRCETNKKGKCSIKAVLSWNDFKNDVDPGTNKDLDLALADDMLNIVQTSALHQSMDPSE
ncbi:MAG TPA: S8 family serine peptidase, partial [Pseudobdellovibrionaceae bacterium]